jgi:O-antigen ligase
VLYLAYSILNVVNSYLFWDPHVNRIYQSPLVNVVELGLRFLSAGALVMMATSISNAKWLRYITTGIIVVGLYNVLNAIIGARIPIIAPWWSLIAIMPACYFFAIVMSSSYTRTKRVVAAVVVAVICYTVFYRSIAWVSGWIGLFAGIGAVALVINRRAFFIGFVLIAMICLFQWSFISQSVFGRSAQDGDYERFELMRGAWKYATTFPLGVGIGNYRTYNAFHYGQIWGTASFTSAHGTYSQHLAEMGIIGLALLLSILVGGFRWLLQCYRKMADGPPKVFLIAAMGQLVGISCSAIIGDYIIPTYHNGGLTTFSTTVYSWLIWGLAIAYVRVSKEATND